MLFRQIVHEDLGCASYLVGDPDAGVAAVVDPKLAVDEYLRLAEYLGVRIEHILETHNHADHVSGHGALAAATGARIHIHRDAAPEYDAELFDDGWQLELGRVLVRAIHTPGHRPEHTAFALVDSARGDEPWAVLTGDTLFVGDVARPDLAIEKEDGARGMFRSLHERLLTLPESCEVWPGHLGGSLCGGPGMDLKVSSTIAYERAHSRLLQIKDEEEFVEAAVTDLPPQPPNFERIVGLNRGPLANSADLPRLLTVRETTMLMRDGALVIDIRSDEEFDAGHIPGSVSISARHPGFGSRLAWVAAQADSLVFVGSDDDEAQHAGALAAAVGVDQVAGVLEGGLAAWRVRRRPLETFARLTVAALHERLEAGDELQILDVRERSEWERGHIAGSLHTPYHDITALPDGLDPHRPVTVTCASGQRAAVGASLAALHGAREVLHVVGGGVPTLGELGWPLEREPALTPAD